MRFARKEIIAELDDIAGQIEKTIEGGQKFAASIDTVSNTLEQLDRQASRKKAEAPNVPDWEASDEPGRQDSYDATGTYHKFPVGQDSVSRVLDRPSAKDSDLNIAEEGPVNIQASQELANLQASLNTPFKEFEDLTPHVLSRLASQGQWDEVARAAKMGMTRQAMEVADPEGDPGDPGDDYSTSGLPETGGDTPIDDDQTGDDLSFYGTLGPGELHMPSGSGSKGSPDPKSLMTKGRTPATAALRAREVLKRAAQEDYTDPAGVHKQDPKQMGMGPGDVVERDQELGGRGKGAKDTGPDPLDKVASNKLHIKRPSSVPKELHSVFASACKKVNASGQIRTANKEINYPEIMKVYQGLLAGRRQARTNS